MRELWRAATCVLIVFLALAGSVAGGAGASEDARSKIRWAADSEGGAPYIFKDPKDPAKLIGFEVDLAAALGAEVGCEIEFVQYQFGSLIPGLARKDFDFAMNGLEVTPDRAKVVRFSRPYYVYRQQLVARADETRFGSLQECREAGGLVGTLEDTAAERLLDAMQVRKRIYDGQVEPYQDLGLGRLDAVLLDLPIALVYAKPNPKLKFVGPAMGEGYYAMAFRKNDADLASRFDGALERLAERGELRRIYEKWGLWNDDQQALFDPGRASEALGQTEGRWALVDYLPLLLRGAWMTIQITMLGMLLAVALGLPIALARMSRSRTLRIVATGYVEFFRGIPVLLLLFFLYYGLPSIGARYGIPSLLNLSAFAVAVLGFGLNYAAYEAEIYRAGIGSIPIGQWEAAASLGMSPGLTFRRIILPQAIRVILPPMKLFPHLTAVENVTEAPVHVLRLARSRAHERAMDLLGRVGLADRADAYPRELSGGQKQRVAIARAMAMEPRGLLCDEITSALDPELKCEVLGALEDLKRERLTMIIVTHELGFARRSADRIVVLDGGRVVEEGPPQQVFDHPRMPRTQRFLSQVMS